MVETKSVLTLKKTFLTKHLLAPADPQKQTWLAQFAQLAKPSHAEDDAESLDLRASSHQYGPPNPLIELHPFLPQETGRLVFLKNTFWPETVWNTSSFCYLQNLCLPTALGPFTPAATSGAKSAKAVMISTPPPIDLCTMSGRQVPPKIERLETTCNFSS